MHELIPQMRKQLTTLVIALVAGIGAIALGIVLDSLGFSRDVWLLVAVVCGLIIGAYQVGIKTLKKLGPKARIAVGLSIFAILGVLSWRTYEGRPGAPSAPDPQAQTSPTEPSRPTSSGAQPPATASNSSGRETSREPKASIGSSETRTAAAGGDLVPPASTTSRTATTDCRPSETDSPRNVRLQPDDVVVITAGTALRLDQVMRETRIANGGYLNEVRGVVVDRHGRMIVTTRACGEAAVVSIDPYSGRQTPTLIGQGVPIGIALEADGETVLVGVEHSSGGTWGTLLRLHIAEKRLESLHSFQPTSSAHTLAIHPDSGDIYFADGPMFRIDPKRWDDARRIEVDGLRNAQALTVTPQGEMYVAGYDDGGPVMRIKLGVPMPLETFTHDQFRTVSGLASSRDGKLLYVATGLGSVLKLTLPLPPTAISTWQGPQSGRPSIAVVPSIDR